MRWLWCKYALSDWTCHQTNTHPQADQWPYPVSEDCLYVNVIRPANYSAYKEPLPVAFWLHGGGWRMGGNADRRYNM